MSARVLELDETPEVREVKQDINAAVMECEIIIGTVGGLFISFWVTNSILCDTAYHERHARLD